MTSQKTINRASLGLLESVAIMMNHPFTCIISGPTSSGKTEFCARLVRNASRVIDPPPERIAWHYGIYQKAYTKLPESVDLKPGLPNIEDFDGTNTLVVIDDLMHEMDQSVSLLFTRGSHHKNVSVIFIMQNIFHASKYGRTINLNAHYLVLFKSPRDAMQISYLGRQMYPGKPKFLAEAFADATSRPYGYLFLDLKPNTDEDLRVRTNVLPDERDKFGNPLSQYVYK